MDQIIWTKLSGSSYLDQVIWIKLSGSRNQTLNSNYFARSQTSKVKILKHSIISNQIFNGNRNRKFSKMFQEISQLCETILYSMNHERFLAIKKVQKVPNMIAFNPLFSKF